MPKVVRFHNTGEADVLKVEDLPLTEPGKGEVRLKVDAIGLNRAADSEKEPTEILRWGLTHQYADRNYQVIRRFSSYRIRQHVARGEKSE